MKRQNGRRKAAFQTCCGLGRFGQPGVCIMTRTTRLPATVRALTLVVALLTVLAILPPAPVAASVIRVVSLDDTQPEFGAGSRTLTAVIPTTLSNDPISGQVTEPYAGAKPGDQGGLAMAAIRALRWESSPASPLPAARTEIGAAVIGNTIWVVGGSSGGTGYQSTVYRGTVNTNYGQPGAGVITWVDVHATAIRQPCRYVDVQHCAANQRSGRRAAHQWQRGVSLRDRRRGLQWDRHILEQLGDRRRCRCEREPDLAHLADVQTSVRRRVGRRARVRAHNY
jgi:hypothetical protein